MIRGLQDAMQDDAVINVLSKQEMDDILYSICCDWAYKVLTCAI